MTRFVRGNSKAAKLTNEQVFEILDKYWNHDQSQASLSREYGVVPETIGRICRGDSRKNIPTPTKAPSQSDHEAMIARLLKVQEAVTPKKIQITPDVIAGESTGLEKLQAMANRLPPDPDREIEKLLKGEGE